MYPRNARLVNIWKSVLFSTEIEKDKSHKNQRHLIKFNIHSWFKKKRSLSKLGMNGNILKLIKGNSVKPINNIILTGGKLNAFLPTIGDKAGIWALIAFAQHCSTGHRLYNKLPKNKQPGTQTVKEENILSYRVHGHLHRKTQGIHTHNTSRTNK